MWLFSFKNRYKFQFTKISRICNADPYSRINLNISNKNYFKLIQFYINTAGKKENDMKNIQVARIM
jgi:hypothetical protein